MSDKTPSDTDDEHTTTSVRERWEYIGSFLAGVLIISLCVIVIGAAAGVFTLSTIPQGWLGLYGTITLMAAVWTFGKEALKAVRNSGGN